jgi:hypothetical protein
MNAVFSAGVKYTRQNEDGTFKRVTEFFIVSAISFTDVEAKLTEEMAQRTQGEFLVSSIKRTNYQYVLTNEEDEGTFCHATISYKMEDEGSKKKIKINFLIEVSDIEKVHGIIKNQMDGTIADFEVIKVEISPIMHVID